MTKRIGALVTLHRDVTEIEELCRSADIELLYEVVQRRPSPDRSYYLGRGRFRELRELVRERRVDVLVINGEIRPSQHFNLENGLKVEVLDRIGVVLDVFTRQAKSRESKLQVELARLRYQVPLMKEWVHSAKAGEHPGFLGGGEYAVDVYYNLIRRRISQIEGELQDLSRVGDLRRDVRRYKGFRTVCLAGYTNAGKSSLMYRLTGEPVLVADRMFSTLGTITRRVGTTKVLLTDTVGFLKDLPPFLVRSFRNTLQDVYSADLVILVVDSSEPISKVRERILAVQDILNGHIPENRVLVAMNKCDVGSGHLGDLGHMVREVLNPADLVFVSALTGEGVTSLVHSVERFLRPPIAVSFTVDNSPETMMEIARIYDCCYVEEVEYSDMVKMSFRCEPEDLNMLIDGINLLPGIKEVLVEHVSLIDR